MFIIQIAKKKISRGDHRVEMKQYYWFKKRQFQPDVPLWQIYTDDFREEEENTIFASCQTLGMMSLPLHKQQVKGFPATDVK